jgi:hypothetical protein
MFIYDYNVMKIFTSFIVERFNSQTIETQGSDSGSGRAFIEECYYPDRV